MFLGWTKTIFKFSDRICYSFWAYSDERKHFWSPRIRFAIDFRRFRTNDYNFEVFRWYFQLILSFFWWKKLLLKPLHTICYRYKAFSDRRKHFWRLQILFAIDFERFLMNENTFEAFAYYIRFRMDEKKILKASDRICYWF